jgi:hypothetical protein
LTSKVSSGVKDNEKKVVTQKQWTILACSALLIAGFDIVMLILAQIFNQYIWTFASIGVVTFIGMLSTANYASKTLDYKGGEMRTALASSIVIMYLVLVSFFSFSTKDISSPMAASVLQHFTYVVEIVIVFYFGSKAVMEGIKKLKE